MVDQAQIEKLPPLYRDMYEERAAIMEYEGGLDRDQAQAHAWEEVQKAYRTRFTTGSKIALSRKAKSKS